MAFCSREKGLANPMGIRIVNDFGSLADGDSLSDDDLSSAYSNALSSIEEDHPPYQQQQEQQQEHQQEQEQSQRQHTDTQAPTEMTASATAGKRNMAEAMGSARNGRGGQPEGKGKGKSKASKGPGKELGMDVQYLAEALGVPTSFFGVGMPNQVNMSSAAAAAANEADASSASSASGYTQVAQPASMPPQQRRQQQQQQQQAPPLQEEEEEDEDSPGSRQTEPPRTLTLAEALGVPLEKPKSNSRVRSSSTASSASSDFNDLKSPTPPKQTLVRRGSVAEALGVTGQLTQMLAHKNKRDAAKTVLPSAEEEEDDDDSSSGSSSSSFDSSYDSSDDSQSETSEEQEEPQQRQRMTPNPQMHQRGVSRPSGIKPPASSVLPKRSKSTPAAGPKLTKAEADMDIGFLAAALGVPTSFFETAQGPSDQVKQPATTAAPPEASNRNTRQSKIVPPSVRQRTAVLPEEEQSPVPARPIAPVKTLSLAEALGMPLEKPKPAAKRPPATRKQPPPQSKAPTKSLMATVIKNVSESESEDSDESSSSENDDDDFELGSAPPQSGSLASALGMTLNPSTQPKQSLFNSVIKNVADSASDSDSDSEDSYIEFPVSDVRAQAGSLAAALGMSVDPPSKPAPRATKTSANKPVPKKSLLDSILNKVKTATDENDSRGSPTSTAQHGSLAEALGMQPPSNQPPSNGGKKSLMSSVMDSMSASEDESDYSSSESSGEDFFATNLVSAQVGSLASALGMKIDESPKAPIARVDTSAKTSSAQLAQSGSLAAALGFSVAAQPPKKKTVTSSKGKTLMSTVLQRIAESDDDESNSDSSSADEAPAGPAPIFAQSGSLASALGMSIDPSSRAAPIRRGPANGKNTAASSAKVEPASKASSMQPQMGSLASALGMTLGPPASSVPAKKNLFSSVMKNVAASDSDSDSEDSYIEFPVSDVRAQAGSLAAALGMSVDPPSKTAPMTNKSVPKKSLFDSVFNKVKTTADENDTRDSPTSRAQHGSLAEALGMRVGSPSKQPPSASRNGGKKSLMSSVMDSMSASQEASDSEYSLSESSEEDFFATNVVRAQAGSLASALGMRVDKSPKAPIARVDTSSKTSIVRHDARRNETMTELAATSPGRTLSSSGASDAESKLSVIDSFYEHVAEVRGEMTDLISEISQTKLDMSGVRKEINIMENRIMSLESTNDGTTKQVSATSEAEKSLKIALMESEAKTAGVNAYSKTLEERLFESSKTYSDRLSQLHGQLSAFESKISDKSDKIRRLEADIDSEQRSKGAISERWIQTETKLENVCVELQESRELLRQEYADIKNLKQSMIGDRQPSENAVAAISTPGSPVIESRTSDVLRNMETSLRREGERRKSISARLRAMHEDDPQSHSKLSSGQANEHRSSLAGAGGKSLSETIVATLTMGSREVNATEPSRSASGTGFQTKSLAEALGVPLEKPLQKTPESRTRKTLSDAVVARLSKQRQDEPSQSTGAFQTKTLAEALGLPMQVDSDYQRVSSQDSKPRKNALSEAVMSKMMTANETSQSTNASQTKSLAEALGLPLEKPAEKVVAAPKPNGKSLSSAVVGRMADGRKAGTTPDENSSPYRTLSEALGLDPKTPVRATPSTSEPNTRSLSSAVVQRMNVGTPSTQPPSQTKTLAEALGMSLEKPRELDTVNQGKPAQPKTLAEALGLSPKKETTPVASSSTGAKRGTLSAAVTTRLANGASNTSSPVQPKSRTLAEALGLSPKQVPATSAVPAAKSRSLSAAVVQRLQTGEHHDTTTTKTATQSNTLADALGLSPLNNSAAAPSLADAMVTSQTKTLAEALGMPLMKPTDSSKHAASFISDSKPKGKSLSATVVENMSTHGGSPTPQSFQTKTLAEALGIPLVKPEATPKPSSSPTTVMATKVQAKTLGEALGLSSTESARGDSAPRPPAEKETSPSTVSHTMSVAPAMPLKKHVTGVDPDEASPNVTHAIGEDSPVVTVKVTKSRPGAQDPSEQMSSRVSPHDGQIRRPDPPQRTIPKSLTKVVLSNVSTDTPSLKVKHERSANTLAEALGLPKQKRHLLDTVLNDLTALRTAEESSSSNDSGASDSGSDYSESSSSGSECSSDSEESDGTPHTLANALGVDTEVVSEKQMLQIELGLLKKQVESVVGTVSTLKNESEAPPKPTKAISLISGQAVEVASRDLLFEEKSTTSYRSVAVGLTCALLVIILGAPLYMATEQVKQATPGIPAFASSPDHDGVVDLESLLASYPVQTRQAIMRQRIAASAKRRNVARKMTIASEVQACVLVPQEAEPILPVNTIGDSAKTEAATETNVQDPETSSGNISAEEDLSRAEKLGMETIAILENEGFEVPVVAQEVPEESDDVSDEEVQAAEEEQEEVWPRKFSYADSQQAANLLALKEGRTHFLNRITRDLPEKLLKKEHKALGRKMFSKFKESIAKIDMQKIGELVQMEIEDGLWM